MAICVYLRYLRFLRAMHAMGWMVSVSIRVICGHCDG